jgi:hypothetical protein
MARNYNFKVRATVRRQRDNKVFFNHCFDVFQMFRVQVFEGIHPVSQVTSCALDEQKAFRLDSVSNVCTGSSVFQGIIFA